MISFLDSTLRDGAQAEEISFSLQDKLTIVQTLDEFGIDLIEAGIPSANPKDMAFFQEARKLTLKHAKLCAFGATRHRDTNVTEDAGLKLLLEAETSHITLFGKASLLHVSQILGVAPEENLAMIQESIRFLCDHGRTVLFDAEHFFDGYVQNPEYAMSVIRTALDAGASSVTLCDTNGATVPTDLRRIVTAVIGEFPQETIGIHCHNDIGCAVANSMLAVEAGATLVQGTFSGYGERCGNADLSILVPNLILKKHCQASITNLENLCATATRLAEIANIAIPAYKPYIGRSAFAHKGGMHIDAVLKAPVSFEHIAPEAIGNHRRFLVSEVSGRSTLLQKVQRIAPQITRESPELAEILATLKQREYEGYQYEAADASLELLIRKILHWHHPHFKLILYKTTGEFPSPSAVTPCSAMIQVEVGETAEISAALGNGPVNALDSALRKALNVFFPQLQEVQLIDYKVRVIDTDSATAAKVRVLIESSDGPHTWTTVGVSTDIIEASWLALQDSIEYKLSVL